MTEKMTENRIADRIEAEAATVVKKTKELQASIEAVRKQMTARNYKRMCNILIHACDYFENSVWRACEAKAGKEKEKVEKKTEKKK